MFVTLLSLGVAACEGRPKAAVSGQEHSSVSLGLPSITELDLSRGVPELIPSTLFGTPQRRTHTDLVQTLRDLQAAGSTKGVFVHLGMTQIGLARAHEIGRLLADIRKQGQPVLCHADSYDNASFLLAAAGCSKIWVSPGGQIEPVGLAAQLVYASRLLEKLKVDVDFLQVGKFKGADETFTRDSPSPEARASLENALKGLRSAWIGAIVKGRGNEALAESLEDGPFLPDEAKAKGLIDAVGFLEEARNEAKQLAGVTHAVVRFGAAASPDPSVSRDLVDILRAISGSGSAGTPHVAVVPAIGAITMGGGGSLPFGGSDGITERDLGRMIDKLASDSSTKAVVLRIDSPGGSALASDLLWKKLMKLRESKPVVVSIGGMAASGGYYLACTATKIVAEPASIVGSIGVVGGKFSIGRALEEVGVHAEIIAASPDPVKAARAAYMSPFSPWDDATRQRVLAQMNFIYDLFLRRVAEGRNLPVGKVSESAEGRLFAGVEAQERGLVDQIGGLDDAIKLAMDLGKLPVGAPVEFAEDTPRFIDLLDGEPGAQGRSNALAERAESAVAAALLPGWSTSGPELGDFFTSIAPLAAGERTLVAMPFVVRVR
jgi:protease-4